MYMKNGKVRRRLVLALALFVFLASSMVYEAFELNFMVLDDIFRLLSDSSNFLTWLCVFLILGEIVRRERSYIVVCVNILDIVLVNKLYLNTNLASLGKNIQTFFVELEWQTVAFYGFLGGIIVWCLWIARKDYRESAVNDKKVDSKTNIFFDGDGVQNKGNESVGKDDKSNYTDTLTQNNIFSYPPSPIPNSVEFGNTNNSFETADDLDIASASVSNSKFRQEAKNGQREWLSKRMQFFFHGSGYCLCRDYWDFFCAKPYNRAV